MEQFIKQKKRDLILCRIVYILSLVIAVGSIVLSELNILVSADGTNAYPISAPCIGSAVVTVWEAVGIKKALRDPDRMRAILVAETDERKMLIERSASRMTFLITLVLLVVTTFVFAYINGTVYHTLMTVLVVYLLVFVLCNLFYTKKY